MSLTIQVRQTTIVALSGRLDSSTSPRAEEVLAPVLKAAPRHVVFDLAGLDFISSAGLRVLFGARKKLGDAGGECLLVNPKPQIERVLEAIGSLPGMRIFTSSEEADAYLTTLQERVLEGE